MAKASKKIAVKTATGVDINSINKTFNVLYVCGSRWASFPFPRMLGKIDKPGPYKFSALESDEPVIGPGR